MSPGTPDWRNSISFSERLQSILRIQIAYQASSVRNTSADAQLRAKAVESDTFATATSKDLYQLLIKNHIHNLEAVVRPVGAISDAELDDDVDQLLAGGITIGDYVNASNFKDGQFSTIYKAKSLKRFPSRERSWKGETVALKVTSLSAQVPPHDARKEARLLAVAASEHVIQLLDTFTAQSGDFVMVFPLVPLDLDEMLKRGNMSEDRAKLVTKDLLSALVHIHGLGMIHRDIKPSNILFQRPNGPACLADFGIAWWRDDPACEPSDRKILDVGTTCYRPPELMFGNESYGPSLDMWATGCVLAQLFGLGSRTLFDSGDLGSDLALIKSIFETLGTPDLEVWPEAAGYPDWGKMAFKQYPAKSWSDILPETSRDARDLISGLVRYESKDRLIAAEVGTFAHRAGSR
ncbi:hypothetical protein CAC42_8116 [Sphaceloma murrayae]|uniref:cyclin-dependent kinase n=1 Tax=Sphaceloma murrayae TaxID=2082308 RepID=A0A2K1QRT8_9PEZI|nr:hypothetical protein CAC42_8116 [Sphaceloma murrayae]